MNKIGQAKKWLSRRLSLGGSRHNDCFLFHTSRVETYPKPLKGYLPAFQFTILRTENLQVMSAVI
ncbi:hypothetical protein HMPREF1991_02643 [Hoylesella loescheii DSM 19665 = JCM 12249 = ATCC 15930]|uniref:Uncharacterized protein n=1 Tax=Hoylesella loescheii DSM 19665 = JCM 12249 = ATCC 15930 TaxID=1122985 RepID=A0A069QGX5_HOYLO|nr:hypothetical protein HMPREF1991_02643 [Hoylesella loescheii DSM 19665 = JCM 12249 = ATCC 15930]